MRLGHVPVELIVSQERSAREMANLRKQITTAIRLAERERPGSLAFLPDNSFSILVWWHYVSFSVYLLDDSLKAYREVHGYSNCIKASCYFSLSNRPPNPYIGLIANFAEAVVNGWSFWVRWRMGMNPYGAAEPAWLTEVKESARAERNVAT